MRHQMQMDTMRAGAAQVNVQTHIPAMPASPASSAAGDDLVATAGLVPARDHSEPDGMDARRRADMEERRQLRQCGLSVRRVDGVHLIAGWKPAVCSRATC